MYSVVNYYRIKNLNKRINYFPNLVEYLSLLASDEFIYQGEQTKYIPIILQPPVEKETQKISYRCCLCLFCLNIPVFPESV